MLQRVRGKKKANRYERHFRCDIRVYRTDSESLRDVIAEVAMYYNIRVYSWSAVHLYTWVPTCI